MKRIILVAVAIVSLVACNQTKKEEKKTDLKEANLKGKVKSVREITYNAVEKFGEIEKGDRSSGIVTIYNEQGNEIEVNRYNSDDSLDWKFTYKYDDKGNQIEVNRYKSDGSLDCKET